jgi:glycosylphosphatidylinositol transamidase
MFLYLMKSVDSFISVADYLAAPILVSAGITITGLKMWNDLSDKRRDIGRPMIVMALSHLVGLAMLAAVSLLEYTKSIPVSFSPGMLVWVL